MHQRSWLTLLSLPLVGAFTVPVVVQNVPPPKAAVAKVPQDPLAGMADIQDVLGLIRDNYVDAPDMEKVLAGGIQGVIEKAHPLNALLSPEDLRLPDPGPADLGMVILKRAIYAQVVAVHPGGPAAKAGIQPGDVIRKFDGDSIGPMSAWSLERRLRGPVGSDVSLLRYALSDNQLAKVTLQRELPQRLPLGLRKEEKATLITVPDLSPGRAAELKALLQNVDRKNPLVLDLRTSVGGTLAEAAQAGGMLASGPLATVQEAGGKEAPLLLLPGGIEPFHKVALLVGPGTLGAPEALASALKKAGLRVIGDRTAGLGVERSRILLRQGGALEIVSKRWVGAGGEKLDRQGVVPDQVLRGLKADEDPLPKVLPLLDTPLESVEASKHAAKVAVIRFSSRHLLQTGEVA